jgi:hypothetical protein
MLFDKIIQIGTVDLVEEEERGCVVDKSRDEVNLPLHEPGEHLLIQGSINKVPYRGDTLFMFSKE